MSNHVSRQQRRAEERLGPRRSRLWLNVFVWVVGIAVVGTFGWWLSRPASEKTPTQLADASDLALCVSHGGLSQHIHPHLTIVVDGQEREIPMNVGITSDCLRPMHTHDASGIIHIESPRVRNFTVGQFFGIWNNEYSSTTFMDIPLDTSRQMKLFVNGKEVTTGPATVMHDRTSYAIVVGKSGETLTAPANFDFPANI